MSKERLPGGRPATSRATTLTIRIGQAEKLALEALARERGTTMSRLMTIAIRVLLTSRAVFLDDQAKMLEELTRQVLKAGVNLNQIARSIHKGAAVTVDSGLLKHVGGVYTVWAEQLADIRRRDNQRWVDGETILEQTRARRGKAEATKQDV
jgi:hypothetical protein